MLGSFQNKLSKSNVMESSAWNYAESILIQVSRTFALNINVLKGKLHKTILLAYLYLRIADTIEDDPKLKAIEKENLLNKFAHIFKTKELSEASILDFENSLPSDYQTSNHPYMDLCRHTHVVVPLLRNFSEKYASPIRDVTIEMCKGMSKFAKREETALNSGWFTINSVSQLDEYCYYVAGIVGKLLTNLFVADSFLINDIKKSQMQKLDVSFGLALQVANIVKDCREDSERRVCFIPEEICRKYGFNNSYEIFDTPCDEQVDDFSKRRSLVIKELVLKTWNHLEDAISYVKCIPRIKMRTRLFCLWPLFMAAENMKLIGEGSSIFKNDKKVKITRDTVKRIIRSTLRHFYSNNWIEKEFNKLKNYK